MLFMRVRKLEQLLWSLESDVEDSAILLRIFHNGFMNGDILSGYKMVKFTVDS